MCTCSCVCASHLAKDDRMFVSVCVCVWERAGVCAHVSVRAAVYPSPRHLAAPTEPIAPVMNGLPALPAVAIRGRATYYIATYLKWTAYYIAAYLLGWWAPDTSHYLLGRAAAMWEQGWDGLGYQVCMCVCVCVGGGGDGEWGLGWWGGGRKER